MFSAKKVEVDNEGESVAQSVSAEAERLYRTGKMHCAESVLASVKNQFLPELGDEVVRLASGFGGGSGAGCICGAVSGGTMALGLVMDGDRKGVANLTKELHAWFKQEYRVTCCKVLTAKGKGGCVDLTARVAGKIAELLEENRRS